MSPKMETALIVESRSGLYVARLLPEVMGVGSIIAPERPIEELRQYAEWVLESISPVAESELKYSDCTDGRFRTKLEDGQPVPNREKGVGADIMLGFHVAETLGSKFYEDPAAPLEVRIEEVIDHLERHGIIASTHNGCGACGEYKDIANNILEFAGDPIYAARQKLLLPDGIYNDAEYRAYLDGARKRVLAGRYENYDPAKITEAVLKKNGGHAVANLLDDGRGVHGHVEAGIARLKFGGESIDVNRFAEISGGQQIFPVNDSRIEKLAETFGRGHDSDYRLAYIAGEDFTDAGHATLGSNMPTFIIEKAA